MRTESCTHKLSLCIEGDDLSSLAVSSAASDEGIHQKVRNTTATYAQPFW